MQQKEIKRKYKIKVRDIGDKMRLEYILNLEVASQRTSKIDIIAKKK